ncbi:MMPL family transporter [Paenisporosarcina cavernae]|uniref:MMPL family transporter n=1 Tax=Paenisporosarcina cavernae TaxID=2320858 RepID=A0A385YV67_9BACL|nr:MMPL family transporter [Paenisporosarcina cavernae]AYC30444.1 MMPL family transporter [Paenisporosarcina cavernae]
MKQIASVVTRFYKSVLIIWLIAALALGYFASLLPSILEGDGFRVDGEHEKVMKELSETFDLPEETLLVVFKNQSDSEITSILNDIKSIDEIDSIQSPLENDTLVKGSVSYAILELQPSIPHMADVVHEVNEVTSSTKGVALTGGPAISEDINEASQSDLAHAEMIGLPIAVIVLLFAFGSLVASIVPLIIGLFTVVISFGTLYFIGVELDLSIFVLNIVPMLGLALSIDFSLLFINRYREERKKSSIIEAIHTTIGTAGRSIIFSAICVFIGLGAMLVIQVEIFQNIAIGGMVIVTVAVLSSLTLLPAVIRLIGDRLNKWTIVKVKDGASNNWRKFANFVMRHPITITIAAVILLAIGMIPVKDMDLAIPQADALPNSFESRQAYDLLDTTFDFGSTSSNYLLIEREDAWDSKKGYEEIEQLTKTLEQDSLVKEFSTIFTEGEIKTAAEWEQAMQVPQISEQLTPLKEVFIEDNQLFVPVTLSVGSTSDAAADWVREWSSKDDISVAGNAKFNQEIFDEITNKIALALAIILISTFIILMVAFRSIIIPLKAIVMNILGLSATFGILVFLFQYGHLGIDPGTIALVIPVIVFSLVFGLSMDYEVFLISRIQEEYLKHNDNTRATVEGLTNTSKIITSAALIMIVITGAFAFTDVMPVKQIGVGIAIAVAIDATIIRLMLVPSLMKLFGKWNWWLPFKM